jgi:hypothetical protein
VAGSAAGKRVAILGAGANGAGVGAELAAAGVDVTLIEQWPAHVEKMRADGLRIEMPDRVLEQPVTALHLCEVAEVKQPFDVVLMLMKAYDTRWAAELIKPVLAADGLLAGVQDGFTADTIAEVVGPERAIGCVIECSAMMEEPGVVERQTPPESSWFAVGSFSEATAGRESEVADLLDHAGRTEIVADIRSAKWMKLVSNATTLVTTAVRGPADLRPHRRGPRRSGLCRREAPRHPLRGLRPTDHDHDDPPRLVEGPPQRGRRHQRRRRGAARRAGPGEPGGGRDGPPHRTRRAGAEDRELRGAGEVGRIGVVPLRLRPSERQCPVRVSPVVGA